MNSVKRSSFGSGMIMGGVFGGMGVVMIIISISLFAGSTIGPAIPLMIMGVIFSCVGLPILIKSIKKRKNLKLAIDALEGEVEPILATLVGKKSTMSVETNGRRDSYYVYEVEYMDLHGNLQVAKTDSDYSTQKIGYVELGSEVYILVDDKYCLLLLDDYGQVQSARDSNDVEAELTLARERLFNALKMSAESNVKPAEIKSDGEVCMDSHAGDYDSTSDYNRVDDSQEEYDTAIYSQTDDSDKLKRDNEKRKREREKRRRNIDDRYKQSFKDEYNTDSGKEDHDKCVEGDYDANDGELPF